MKNGLTSQQAKRFTSRAARRENVPTEQDYDWPTPAEIRLAEVDEMLLDLARFPEGWCGDGICNCAECP